MVVEIENFILPAPYEFELSSIELLHHVRARANCVGVVVGSTAVFGGGACANSCH